MIGNNSVQSSEHEETVTSDEEYIEDKGKDTNEDNGDNTKNDNDDIGQNNSELFNDSNDGVISTNDSIVLGRNVDIGTGPDCKRKAESGDGKTEDGRNKEIMTKSKVTGYYRIRMSLSVFSFSKE